MQTQDKYLIELLMLDRNTWNHLTVCKQMSSKNHFKIDIPANHLFTTHIHIYIYIYIYVRVENKIESCKPTRKSKIVETAFWKSTWKPTESDEWIDHQYYQ